ncbi:MAG: MBL fold metallo-hydrolase [Ilumatobacteraceae bacterium]
MRSSDSTSGAPGAPGASGESAAPGVPVITWLGHASTVIDIAGVKVLTDPALTTRVAHLRRHHEVDVAAIGRPDLVLISHLHMDHLHIPSLRLFGRAVPLVVPAGAGPLLRRRGFADVREARAGETIDVGPLTVEVVPAVHSSRRGPHTRLRADAVGYVLRAGGVAVYFPGDTDLFAEMGSWAPVDVALLPIWGWGPDLGEGHLDPERAVEAAGLVEPRMVVPIHWGTFSPMGLRRGRPDWLDQPVHRFRSGLDRAGIADRLHVLTPGTSLAVPVNRAAP